MSRERFYVLEPDDVRPTRVELRPYYAIKAQGSDTEGRFTFRLSDVRQDIRRHTHVSQDESLYILEGELDVILGKEDPETHHLTPGMYVFLPHGIPHALRNLSPGGVRMLVVGSPSGDEHYFEDIVERRNALGYRDDTSAEYIEMARRNGVIYDLDDMPSDAGARALQLAPKE
jgi:uncharacterized cupin superfamily protein